MHKMITRIIDLKSMVTKIIDLKSYLKDIVCIITDEPKPVQVGSVFLVFVSDSLGIHLDQTLICYCLNLIVTGVGEICTNVQGLLYLQPDAGGTPRRLCILDAVFGEGYMHIICTDEETRLPSELEWGLYITPNQTGFQTRLVPMRIYIAIHIYIHIH